MKRWWLVSVNKQFQKQKTCDVTKILSELWSETFSIVGTMENRVNSVQPTSHEASTSITDPLPVFASNNVTRFIGPLPIASSNQFQTNSGNIFGPVSYTQMRFLPLVRVLQKTSPDNAEKSKIREIKDDTGGKFLMSTTNKPREDDKDSREAIEMRRAECAKFVQELTLATVQSENFRP